MGGNAHVVDIARALSFSQILATQWLALFVKLVDALST
jgi:hypothetical protein